MNDSPLLKADSISLSFGHHKILSRLSMELQKGEILGITGVSGAGKSTLLNVLTGLLEPDSGKVSYNSGLISEKNIVQLELKRHKNLIRPYIGYSTQTPSFYEDLKVTENLDFFGAMYGVPNPVRQNNISLLVKLMELSDVEHKPAKRLSGGMRKRLDIACALVHNPKILFLDEPTSDLDPILRRKVLELVNNLNRQGTSIIISSHFLTEIEGFCSRIGILHKGRIIKLIEKNKRAPIVLWLEFKTSPARYEAIAEELLKHEVISPEDISIEPHSLMIRTTQPERLKPMVIKAGDKLGVKVTKCSETTQTLKDIFERIVK